MLDDRWHRRHCPCNITSSIASSYSSPLINNGDLLDTPRPRFVVKMYQFGAANVCLCPGVCLAEIRYFCIRFFRAIPIWVNDGVQPTAMFATVDRKRHVGATHTYFAHISNPKMVLCRVPANRTQVIRFEDRTGRRKRVQKSSIHATVMGAGNLAGEIVRVIPSHSERNKFSIRRHRRTNNEFEAEKPSPFAIVFIDSSFIRW